MGTMMKPIYKARIQEAMQRAIDRSQVMGVSLLVEKDGEEYIYAQEGLADQENQVPIRRDTLFRLYSQTKPVTGAAAMILVERGLLDLYQPVSDFLPDYEHIRVAKDGDLVKPNRPMLVVDLLNMTSGLPYPGEEGAPWLSSKVIFDEAIERLGSDHEMSTRELADRLAKCPLAFSPGEGWMYGTSADVLGAVIEECAGMRFGEFLQKELFDPLEMGDTGFYVPAEKQDRLAKVYGTKKAEDGTAYMKEYTGTNLAISHQMQKPPAYEAGGAGLVSTLDDYLAFARMLLNEGRAASGQQILSAPTVRFFTGAQLTRKQQEAFEAAWLGLEGHSYAHLMRICKHPGRSGALMRKGEYGWDGWLGVYFGNFPAENMTFLMGTQKEDGGTFELTRKLRNIVLSSLES